MLVEERFLVALALTILIEVGVLLILFNFLFKRDFKNSKLIIIGSMLSVLSLPYLWFVLPPFINARYYLLYGEIIIIVAEALLLSYLLKLRISRALLVSVLINAASFLAGFAIF